MKVLLGLISILFLTQACNSENKSNHNINNSDENINKEAPFYTHKLPVNSPRIFKNYDSTKLETFYPFNIYKDGSYMVCLEIGRDPKVFNSYQPIFDKYDYNGSGNDWAALVYLIIKKENPELIKQVQFDPEGGGFYLFADSEKTQRQVATIMTKAFGDTTKFEEFLKNADKEKIESYSPSN